IWRGVAHLASCRSAAWIPRGPHHRPRRFRRLERPYLCNTSQAHKMTLGAVDALSAARARASAKDILAAVRLGRNPAAEKRRALNYFASSSRRKDLCLMRDLGVTADEHSSAAFWHRSA